MAAFKGRGGRSGSDPLKKGGDGIGGPPGRRGAHKKKDTKYAEKKSLRKVALLFSERKCRTAEKSDPVEEPA